MRSLVALLHVLQPVVRLWGRLRTRALPGRVTTEARWTGERDLWIATVEQELLARRVTVRRGTDVDDWDLEVRRGPLVRARVTAAVLWHWTPVARVRYRPSRFTLAAVVAGAITGVWMPVAGLGVAAGIALAAPVNALLLRATLQDALTDTTKATRDG